MTCFLPAVPANYSIIDLPGAVQTIQVGVVTTVVPPGAFKSRGTVVRQLDSLRSMAVLVGRNKVIKAGEGRETARRLGRERFLFFSRLRRSCARLDKTACYAG